MKPLIGITANRMLHFDNTDDFPFEIDHSLSYFSRAVAQAGGIPLSIPMVSEDLAADYLKHLDGLILTGGEDVNPRLYQALPGKKLGRLNLDRDRMELALFKEALKQGKAILGVCRGLQLVNVGLGGSLIQDLDSLASIQIQHSQKGHPSQVHHPVNIDPDSHLASLVQTDLMVNSYHHQAIDRLAESLRPVAISPDQVIEAVEWIDDQHSLLALQWHPEMNADHNPDSQAIFKDFIQRAKKSRA